MTVHEKPCADLRVLTNEVEHLKSDVSDLDQAVTTLDEVAVKNIYKKIEKTNDKITSFYRRFFLAVVLGAAGIALKKLWPVIMK